MDGFKCCGNFGDKRHLVERFASRTDTYADGNANPAPVGYANSNADSNTYNNHNAYTDSNGNAYARSDADSYACADTDSDAAAGTDSGRRFHGLVKSRVGYRGRGRQAFVERLSELWHNGGRVWTYLSG